MIKRKHLISILILIVLLTFWYLNTSESSSTPMSLSQLIEEHVPDGLTIEKVKWIEVLKWNFDPKENLEDEYRDLKQLITIKDEKEFDKILNSELQLSQSESDHFFIEYEIYIIFVNGMEQRYSMGSNLIEAKFPGKPTEWFTVLDETNDVLIYLESLYREQ